VVKPVKDFIDSFAQIMFRITNMVLQLTPYGVFSLMVSVSANNGLSTLIPLAKVIIAMYIACAIHLVFIHGSLIAFVAKVNPITFFKKLSPALVVAFTTRSSYGTLPVTIETLANKVKISEKISSFVAPLGASMGMNGGGGIYPALISIFVARIFNIHLNVSDYLLLVATTSFASIGIAGVPGAATIASTVVLSTLGLPIEGLAMVLGIDIVIDMVRTMTNVAGASVVALLVASSEDEFDKNTFNETNKDDLKLKKA
ncbi:dicarboxylate/amino acid:cation symporter, partial [Romboutsia sp.]|uniref:dicarboxylate/amino acid:cation symporter n=1 Tax=Romboutsia sp. TaxID=1965302 RepID=UPI002CE3AED1